MNEQGVVRWSHRALNGIFIYAILGGMTLLSVELWTYGPVPFGPAYTFAFLLIWLLVLGAGLALVLLGHAVVRRTTQFLRWPFILLVLAYVVNVPGARRLGPLLTGEDTVHFVVQNESGGPVDWIEIFGRGHYVRIEGIPPDSTVVVPFRGRENDYGARDPYSNRVSMVWFAGGRRRERILVHPDFVIPDRMVVPIAAPDSTPPRASPVTK